MNTLLNFDLPRALLAGGPAVTFAGIYIAGFVTAASLSVALWLRSRRLLRTVARLAAGQEELRSGLSRADESAAELAAQLRQINLELGRVDGAGLRLGLREAIALSRRGVDPRELVSTCGIGDGEARLIALMHGRRTADAAASTDDNLADATA